MVTLLCLFFLWPLNNSFYDRLRRRHQFSAENFIATLWKLPAISTWLKWGVLALKYRLLFLFYWEQAVYASESPYFTFKFTLIHHLILYVNLTTHNVLLQNFDFLKTDKLIFSCHQRIFPVCHCSESYTCLRINPLGSKTFAGLHGSVLSGMWYGLNAALKRFYANSNVNRHSQS